MKKLVFGLVFVLSIAMSLSARTVNLGGGENQVRVLSAKANSLIVDFHLGKYEIENAKIMGSDYALLSLPHEGISQEKGKPQLPVWNRSVIIPAYSGTQYEVISAEYVEADLQVAPSKGIIYRNQNPNDIPFTFDDVYQKNEFYPKEIVSLSDPFILRDFRGITIQSTPFTYNPVTHKLRVYTHYKIKLTFSGTDSRNAMLRSPNKISQSFDQIYQQFFLNYENTRYTSVDEFGKMLVICPTTYLSTIASYVNWKKQKGIKTDLVELSTIGTTAAQIKTYIQNRYNSDPDLTFVQLVGDAGSMPTLSSGGGGSDPSYALVAGSDVYPDIFIGRFSAETTAELLTQVNRTITYERDLGTSATWLSNAMCIASNEGGGTNGDNGESDQAHQTIIRNNLLTYGYSTVDQMWETSGVTTTNLTTAFNAGRGLVNYTGHGSDTSWGTTGFSNTNVNALANYDKLPFIVSVACVNGNFVSITCFAEAWMRANNSGQARGAIAFWGSSINQSWNPPMLAQDEVNRLMINDLKTTAGGLLFNGACKMIDTYGTDGSNMYLTWNIFGDASLLVRTKTPVAMSVSHPSQIQIGQTSCTITVASTPGALVCLSKDGTIYGSGYTNSNGSVTISLSGLPTSPTTMTMTVTAYNRVTYVGSVSLVASAGPSLAVSSFSYTDANNTPEYNESGNVSIVVANAGLSASVSGTATLSTTSTNVTITDNSQTLPVITAGSTYTASNAFAITFANGLADQTSIPFTTTMVSGTNSFTTGNSLVVNAPALSFGNVSITELAGNGNGMLDPGETAKLNITIQNNGHSASVAGNVAVSSTTTGVTLTETSKSFSALAVNGTATLSFQIAIASTMTVGTTANFTFNGTAGSYTATKAQAYTVGIVTEGFETGNFNAFIWQTSGNAAWSVSNSSPYAGTYCAASGTITNNQTSEMAVTLQNSTAGTISFYYKVSSESGYDFLRFYLDGTLQTGWSGEVAWTQTSYSIVAGTHTYKWVYYKDTSDASGSDRGWIDQIIFPNGSKAPLYPPQNLTATANNGSVSLTWQAPMSGTPTNYKVWRGASLLTTLAGTVLSYSDTNVTNETSYSYSVTAVYSSGESTASNTVSATPTASTIVTVAIGTGSTTQTYPIDRNYNYSSHECIYLASEIARSGSITKLAYDKSSGSNVADISSVTIYMKHTTANTLSTGSYSTTGYTQVYSGAFPNTVTSGWMEVTLQTPFVYDGSSNLSILVLKGNQSFLSSGYPLWKYSSSTTRIRQAHSDSSLPSSLTATTYLPNVRFSIATSAVPQAAIAVSPTTISSSLTQGQTATPNFTISNTGTAALTWTAGLRGDETLTAKSRSITGSTISVNPTTYTANQTETLTFSVTNNSNDYEYMKDISVVFPSGITVNSASSFTGGTAALTPNTTTGTGVTITWHGVDSNSFGALHAGQTATATVSITVASGVSGNLSLGYTLGGDVYGSTPHTLTGSLALTNTVAPTDWITLSSSSGSVVAGSSATVSITLNTSALAAGTYTKTIRISSNATNQATLDIPVSLTVTTPLPTYPETPVRAIAEFEPMRGVLIAYPLGIPYSLVARLAEKEIVYTLVDDAATQSTALSNYQTNGVNTANCRFIVTDTDTYWTRDYGPWFVMNGQNELQVIDFVYNRPRPNDDAVPSVVASTLGVPSYTLNVTNTGGNFMTDGYGVAAATNLVLTENTSLTQTQINTQMLNYMGITDYQLYNDPNGTYINHIDCWAKYLDVDKILIRSVPTNHAQYAMIEAAVAAFAAKTSSLGTPYKIYRVNTPNDEPYTNSFIVNKRVFVPQMGTSNDSAALAVYRKAMPGYEVFGFSSGTNVWESTDAIHCRINGLPNTGLVHIQYHPDLNTSSNQDIPIRTYISHSNPLPTDSVYVYWKTGVLGSWHKSSMTDDGANYWKTTIPAQAYGDTLLYAIHAADNTGRNSDFPLCGKLDPFKAVVNVLGLLSAPQQLTITRENNQIKLIWTTVSGATSYQVYGSDLPTGVFSLLGTSSTNSWTQAGGVVADRKYYRVIALKN